MPHNFAMFAISYVKDLLAGKSDSKKRKQPEKTSEDEECAYFYFFDINTCFAILFKISHPLILDANL